jgi:hypothetical protein
VERRRTHERHAVSPRDVLVASQQHGQVRVSAAYDDQVLCHTSLEARPALSAQPDPPPEVASPHTGDTTEMH